MIPEIELNFDGDRQTLRENLKQENIKTLKIDSAHELSVDEASIISNALQHNRTIETIEFCVSSSICKDAMDVICDGLMNYTSMKTITFKYCSLDDDALKAISVLIPNCRVEKIDLTMNLFGCKGFGELVDAVKKSNTLHTLILKFNKIGNDGMEFFDDLLSCKTLKVLDLTTTSITEEGCDKIFSSTTTDKCHLDSLSLNNNDIGNDAIHRLLTRISSRGIFIDTLELTSVGITEWNIENFSSSKHLVLASNHFKDPTFYRFSKSVSIDKHLQIINLSNSNINTKGLQNILDALSSNESNQIWWITLDDNELGDHGAHLISDKIKQHPSLLKYISLRKCGIHSEGATELAQSISNSGIILNVSQDILSRENGSKIFIRLEENPINHLCASTNSTFRYVTIKGVGIGH